MDKVILKKFAVEARQELMDKVQGKIKLFYVDEDFNIEQKGDIYILSNEKHSLSLTNDEYKKRELLIKRIKELSLEQVIEEAAYTWFNRIIAIRYMEINDMLPLTKDNQSLGIRVLSSKDNTPDPEILKFTNLINPELDIDFKKEKYVDLKDDNEKFKYILLLVCKKMGKVIPQVFDGITDYIDILIPDNLLNDTGFITKVINEVPENNYNQVEIIGWLYQFYISERKEKVDKNVKEKKKVEKNDIPAKTQIFTPDWIVKYMVENTLGLQMSEDIAKKMNFKYFIYNDKNKFMNKQVENIKFIDPCCGSGHILVYAFDVFYKIYTILGFNKNDIPCLILENNLYGIDIDDRASQLTILSIILKAREYDKSFFNKDIARNINVCSICESNNITHYLLEEITDDELRVIAEYLCNSFKSAKEFGSILKIDAKYDYKRLYEYILNKNDIFSIELVQKFEPLIKQSYLLSKKYDIVVTNPPYMGSGDMDDQLLKFAKKNYPNSYYDLSVIMMERAMDLCIKGGMVGMINIPTWMNLSSYTNFRIRLIENTTIINLLHLGRGIFGSDFGTVAFTLKNEKIDEYEGIYKKFFEKKSLVESSELKEQKFNSVETFKVNQNNFKVVTGTPIAYNMSPNIELAFKNYDVLDNLCDPKQGLATGDNSIFLRLWYEVDNRKIGFGYRNVENFHESQKLYTPYNKGGSFRKWYGNCEYVIKFNKENYNKLLTLGNHLPSRQFYFQECLTWSKVTMGGFSMRYLPNGFVFDVSGCSIFSKTDHNDLIYILGFLNTKISSLILGFLSPTVNYEVGHIKSLPLKIENKDLIVSLVEKCVDLEKNDWDSSETSWDFKKHPLVRKNTNRISNAYAQFFKENEENKIILKKLEEKINKIFIENYNLQNEIDEKIEENELTLRSNSKECLIRSLISYAVGCMFGRYSLDEEGLVYAGGDFDIDRYKIFKADNDNIIPITDEAYFGDDIVERFKAFIKTVYGDNTFNENMDFIAEALGKKGTETSEETIRRYFVNDFFNDHVKMYQKRPIYWLLDSGKKNGFKALIYMHRYNENLIPKARLDYLHRVQTTYEKLLSDVNYRLTTELSMTDKKEAKNRQTDLMAKLQEIKEYDEKIAHIANQRISIDLDDGVKVNYEKFKDILAKIK